MKLLTKISAAALLAATLAPASFADGRNPGSLLVYPIHRSGAPAGFFTILCITNTNTDPATPQSFGGTTNVMFEYVNTINNPADSQLPLDCYVVDRVETLTPADTLCVLTSCHNAAGGQEGYAVVTAQSPEHFKTAWSFDYLVGSEMVVTPVGGIYSINAIPFESKASKQKKIAGSGDWSGSKADGVAKFDDKEYECAPDTLYIDSFLAVSRSSLTLLNLSGGTQYNAVAGFDIWNDNEFPLSATKLFRCWFEERLEDVSLVFSEDFLRNNTPNDPQELDINCDNVGDFETGWAIIEGIVATSANDTIIDPVFLGAITATATNINGGHLLWEDGCDKNGAFLNFGVN